MAIFGRNNTSTSYTTIENQLTGAVFTLSEAASVKSITADINITSVVKNGKFIIYRHSDLAYMGETQELGWAAGHVQRTNNFATPLQLLAGDYILVAWSVSAGGYGYISYATGTTSQGHYDPATYGTVPNPMVPTHNNYVYNIYATYMPDYAKLFYDSISPTITDSAVVVVPHFKCPYCAKNVFSPGLTISAPIAQTTDYNQKYSFICPNCTSTISLFIALHRDTGGTVACRIQKSSEEGAGGIPANWWVQP